MPVTETRDRDMLLRRLDDARANAERVVERAIAAHPDEPELGRLHGAWDRVILVEQSGGARRQTRGWPPRLVEDGASTVVVNDPALRRELEDAILAYHDTYDACLAAGIPLD